MRLEFSKLNISLKLLSIILKFVEKTFRAYRATTDVITLHLLVTERIYYHDLAHLQ